MKTNPEKGSKSKRLFKVLLKIIITVACFWYISGKISWQQAWNTISTANILWLVAALLLFIASKVVSAQRLNLYFKNAGLELSIPENLKLYWLGMFYNLFLPGAISGDAYKVILLKKKYDASYKKTSAAVLLDRLSGLLGLTCILAGYGMVVIDNSTYEMLVVAAALLSVLIFYLVIKRWLPVFLKSFLPTFLLGLVVQGLQVICIYFLLSAVGIHEQKGEYIFIFLLSSIVSVLPLTIGGLGIRELVFLEGSGWFGLSNEMAVGISLLFYLITVFSSAFGAYFVFKDPLKNKDPLLGP